MRLGQIIKKNKEPLIKNFLIWILVFIIVAIPFGREIGFALVLPVIIPVHINYYLIDKYLKEKRYLLYGIYALVLVFIFGLFAQGLSSNILLSQRGFVEPFLPIKNTVRIIDAPVLRFAFMPLIVVALTAIFKYYREKQLNTIQDLETQRLKSELNMLKHQVNPHFLFNTLNNLFSMSSTYGDEATANGIGHLSHLMRYMLYDTNSDYVRLENEIDMLENFIDLQKLRMDKNADNIEFNVFGNTKNKQIPPMLLIPFVENAFKHGYSVNNEFFLSITLNIHDNNLYVKVDNTINKSRESNNLDSSGIGLENVRKRLDLLYKDEYLLEINEKDNNHHVSLKIPLKE